MKMERLQVFSKKVSQESARRAYISYDMRSFYLFKALKVKKRIVLPLDYVKICVNDGTFVAIACATLKKIL